MYKLLIVDDEPLIRRGIKSLVDLSGLGISEVFEAGDGEQAFEVAEAEAPDIILMDINMPGTDGLTAAAQIRELQPDAVIVILTGYSYFEYAQTAIRAGVDDYILKPVSKDDIEVVLKKAVHRLQAKVRDEHRKSYEQTFEALGEGVDPSDTAEIVAEYMRKNLFEEELSLAKMADDIGFNSSYLSGVIKQIYGLPFQDYVNRERMEKAKLLLLSTSLKNYEIAEEVGIADVNYFITKFKKTWGITPKQYRREKLK